MIIYYDSYCNLCKTSSTLWKKMDWGQKLTFTSFRSMKDYPKTMEEQLHVYDKNKWYQGYSALIQIIKVLPLMWILLPFLYFFKWIGFGDFIYRKVASNRKLVPIDQCNNDGCRIPPKQKDEN